MKKLLGIINIMILTTVMVIPVLAEEKEIKSPDSVEIAEVEEVTILKATPDNATPDDADPEYAYMYGSLVTRKYVNLMRRAMDPDMDEYTSKYALYHDMDSDKYFVVDLDTGKMYADGIFKDEETGTGFRFYYGIKPLIKVDGKWVIGEWDYYCSMHWDCMQPLKYRR